MATGLLGIYQAITDKKRKRFNTDEDIRSAKAIQQSAADIEEAKRLEAERRLAKQVFLRAASEDKDPNAMMNDIMTDPALATSAIQNLNRLKAVEDVKAVPLEGEANRARFAEEALSIPVLGRNAREQAETGATTARYNRQRTMRLNPELSAEADNAAARAGISAGDLTTAINAARQIFAPERAAAEDVAGLSTANLTNARNVAAQPYVSNEAAAKDLGNQLMMSTVPNQILYQQGVTPADTADQLESDRLKQQQLIKLYQQLIQNPRYMNPPTIQEAMGAQLMENMQPTTALPPASNFPPGQQRALPVAPQRPALKLQDLMR